MWDVDSASIVPIIVSAHGLIAKSLDQYLRRLSLGSWVKGLIQKAVLLDTAHITIRAVSRRFLSLEPCSLDPIPDTELNKMKNVHNQSANSIPITQESPHHAMDVELVKKETETPGSLSIAKRKDFVCIYMVENSTEHRTDTNEEVNSGILANITDLKEHVIPPADSRQKFRFKKFYDCLVHTGTQQRLERQIRRQKRPPKLPVTTHDDLTKSQNSFQAQRYPPGQGYPKEEDQKNVTRLRGGFDNDRSSFVVLVLTITAIMLGFTATCLGAVVASPGLRRFFQGFGLLIFIPATFALFVINCIFAYSECGRRPPCSIICLIITVIAMTCIAAAVSSVYKTDIVFQAVLATTIIVIICSILACSNFDFTSYIIYIIVFSLAVFVVSIVFFAVRMITGMEMTIFHLILILISTLVQCAVLIVELQMILGGRAIELSEDEWALGAYYLYTSIVNLFIKMIILIGSLSDD